MSQCTFALTAGIVFLLIALARLLRVVFGTPVVVQDIPIGSRRVRKRNLPERRR